VHVTRNKHARLLVYFIAARRCGSVVARYVYFLSDRQSVHLIVHMPSIQQTMYCRVDRFSELYPFLFSVLSILFLFFSVHQLKLNIQNSTDHIAWTAVDVSLLIVESVIGQLMEELTANRTAAEQISTGGDTDRFNTKNLANN